MAIEKWSGKEAKKAGQKFRREAHSIFAEYQKGLMEKLEEVRVIIRPRPRWISRGIWLWLTNKFVDINNANKALVYESPQQYLARKHNDALEARKNMRPLNSTEVEDLIKQSETTAQNLD